MRRLNRFISLRGRTLWQPPRSQWTSNSRTSCWNFRLSLIIPLAKHREAASKSLKNSTSSRFRPQIKLSLVPTRSAKPENKGKRIKRLKIFWPISIRTRRIRILRRNSTSLISKKGMKHRNLNPRFWCNRTFTPSLLKLSMVSSCRRSKFMFLKTKRKRCSRKSTHTSQILCRSNI